MWLSTGLLLFQALAGPQQPLSGTTWFCWTHNGKGSGTKAIADARPLTWYANNLPAFDSEVSFRVKHEPEWKNITVDLARAGASPGMTSWTCCSESPDRPLR